MSRALADHRVVLADCLGPEGLVTLADRSVDHVITDPPYGKRTHKKQAYGRRGAGYRDGWVTTVGLGYEHLTPKDVAAIGPQLSRVARGWILVMTSHDLVDAWESALGRYTFAPLPIVMPGMNVRLAGDGPSSWTVWLIVNRPRGLVDGTKPGAYVVSPGQGPERAENPVKGHKPVALMDAILRDYSSPGELICDPFAGSGTTGVAAKRLGRRFLGFEREPKYHAIAERRIRDAREQYVLPISREPEPKQVELRAPGRSGEGGGR